MPLPITLFGTVPRPPPEPDGPPPIEDPMPPEPPVEEPESDPAVPVAAELTDKLIGA